MNYIKTAVVCKRMLYQKDIKYRPKYHGIMPPIAIGMTSRLVPLQWSTMDVQSVLQKIPNQYDE
jgi:hypothetical protein